MLTIVEFIDENLDGISSLETIDECNDLIDHIYEIQEVFKDGAYKTRLIMAIDRIEGIIKEIEQDSVDEEMYGSYEDQMWSQYYARIM